MSSFGNAVRRRQAHFRDTSPTISEQGRSPWDDQGRRHGYLLAVGHEDENLYPSLRGASGARRFFKWRGIRWHGSDGPTRNMVSSQIACVNFLLPLADIPGAVAAAVRAIDIAGLLLHGRDAPGAT